MPIEVLEEPRWLEVRLTGSMTTGDSTAARDLIPPLVAGRDLLLDYSGVTDVLATVDALVVLIKSLVPAATHCAILATRPAIFGVNRQAVLLAGLDESTRVRVFMERLKAVDWLLNAAAA